MDAVMSLEVALGGEGTTTHFTFERPLPGVCAVVHFECTVAAKNTVADNALIRVCHFPVEVLNELLKLRCFWPLERIKETPKET